jgi:thiol-disulfide isomerase/thioredoxin
LKNFVVDVINHKFIFTATILAMVVTALILGNDGISATDVLIIIGVALFFIITWRMLLTRASKIIKSVEDFRARVANGRVPTLVQFFSPYCVGCMASKPIVDKLEKDFGAKLQVFRLSIDEEPGAGLMAEYKVLFTPTFILFDKTGQRIREGVLMFDRDGFVRDIERA